MKTTFTILILTLTMYAQEIRTGVQTEFLAGMGYAQPIVSGRISADIIKSRIYFNADSRFGHTAKVDGGSGFQYGVGSSLQFRVHRQFYLGGGVTWSQLHVRDYTKDSYHPTIDAGVFDSRRNWYGATYILSGNDVRNHVQGFRATIRTPFQNRFFLEQNYSFYGFHGTDKPLEHHHGLDVSFTLGFQLRKDKTTR